VNTATVSFRVCVHLACRPTDELTIDQIGALYHREVNQSLRNALKNAAQEGYISNANPKRGRGHAARYTAGPRLLELLGRQ
jgi:cell division septation protein DedD